MLAEVYGIHDATVTPIEDGHTNASFLVVTPGARYVLRRAWAHKPASQIAAEEHVLAHVEAPCDVPRIVATRAGASHALDQGRVHHLFRLARGESGPRYLDERDPSIDNVARVRAAMTRLGELHRALAAVPPAPAEAWLHGRLARLRAANHGGSLASIGLSSAALTEMLARIATVLPHAAPMQWLHGDYHLANLLWIGDEVSAVVDFDDVALGDPALEAGLALHALARQPAGEEAVSFDPALLAAGRAAYAGPLAGDALVFAASQILVHLEAAQRGSWTLGEGIGFWPYWNALTRA